MRRTAAISDPHKDLSLKDLPGEQWMDIYGYDGIYQVSDLGRVKALPREVRCGNNYRRTRERIMRQGWSTRHCLWHVVLCVNWERRTIKISRAVYEAFHNGPPPEGMIVMHRNKVKTDDRLSNLLAVTVAQSNDQNYKMGVSVYQDNLAAQNAARAAEMDALLIVSHTTRICRVCKRELPNEVFHRTDTPRPHRTCLDCRLIKKGIINVGKQRTADELFKAGLRRCNPCGKVKPLTDFGPCKSLYGGRNHRCRDCVRGRVSDRSDGEAGTRGGLREETGAKHSREERGAAQQQTPQP